MITICGETNPFLINLTDNEHPFAINSYLKIMDGENNYPICRIIKTESKKIDGKIQHYASAKIESSIIKPVSPDSKITVPDFDDMKPYIMKTEPSVGFQIGEIMGTEDMNIPKEYKNLFPMVYDGQIETQAKVPYILDYKKLYESPHVGLFGGSGSGKTFALKVIAEELMKKGIPTLLLDPHLEMDFSEKKDRIPDSFCTSFKGRFQIFTIGQNVGIDFCDLLSEELIGILSFSGDLTANMENSIRSIHKTGETLKEFKTKLELLISAFEKRDAKRTEEYTPDEDALMKKHRGETVTSATLSAILWRLNSVNYSGIFNKNIDDVCAAIRNQKLCVLRGGISQLNILASYVISKFYTMRREAVDSRTSLSKKDFFPPFIVAMDESHVFCPRSGKYAPAANILRTISQEGRKYGVFEIMATQRPSLLDTTVVAQMANKFIFRISIKEDLASVEKETDLSKEEIQRLPYLESGECYVSSAISGKTVSIKTRSNTTQEKNAENPFDELSSVNELSPEQEFLLTQLPISELTIDKVVSDMSSKFGKVFFPSEITKILEELREKGKLKVDKGPMGNQYLSV